MRGETKGLGKSEVFITTLFLLVFLIYAAIASAAEGPAVMIVDYEVEPKALMPGDTGTITVTIQNIDTKSSETETTTTVTAGYTSSTMTTSTISAEIETIRLSSRSSDIEWLTEGSQRSEYYNVGALGPGEIITIAIPIKAAAYAHDGTYFPEVVIEVDNGENVRFPVPVKVDSSSVEILEKDIPSEISLGESKEIAIVVANNRPNSVRGVNVFVKSKSDGLEFTPERIYVGNLESYEKRAVNFTLTPQTFKKGLIKNATQQTLGEIDQKREFYFEVAYKNGDNVHHNGLKSSVFVKSIADVKLILVNAPEFVFKGEIVKIEFDVANGMAKDIKAVSVMPAIEGLRILPSESFIGDMEVGDVFSASFDIHTCDLSVEAITIPFTLVFRDVDTDKIYETAGYEVHVEVREPQQSELPNQLFFVAVLVIIALIAVFVWVKVKRKRGRQKVE